MDTVVHSPPSAHRLNDAAFAYYRRLAAVQKYVSAHLSEPISLDQGAKAAGLEKKYFSAFFTAKVGISFTEWIRLLRAERAARLMQAEDLSIIRVAFAAGFRDVRTFERVFKRHFGVTPAAYRAASRPESRRMSRLSGGTPPRQR